MFPVIILFKSILLIYKDLFRSFIKDGYSVIY